MAKFGVSLNEMGLSGETHIQQGVVDKSGAMAIQGIADGIRPVATQIQQQAMVNDLEAIDEEFEEQISQENNPDLKGFEGELKKLQSVKGRISEGAYEARKKAALKRRINMTPGLTQELNSVYSQFDHLNEYSVVNQAIAASKAASDQLDDIEKYGVQNLKMMPGWTQDPTKVAYVQSSAAILQQSELAKAQKGILEANKAGREELATVNGKILQGDIGATFMAWMNPDSPRTIEIPDGQGGVMAVDPLSPQVRNLSPEQKNYLEDILMSEKARYRATVQATVQENNLEAGEFTGTLSLVDSYYDSALGMLGIEGRAQRATSAGTLLTEADRPAAIAFTQEGRERARGGYALEDAQRELQLGETNIDLTFLSNRYLNLQLEQMKQVGALEIMNHPDAQKIVSLASLGIDTNNPAFEAMNRRMVNGYIKDPKSTFQSPENWKKHIMDVTRHYGGLQVEFATEGSASASAEHLDGFVTSVVQAGQNMSLAEQRDIMTVLAQKGVEGLAKKYPEMYASIGQNIEKALPNMGQQLIDKMTTDLANNPEYLQAGIFIKRGPDGMFEVGSIGTGSQNAVAEFKRKYVDTLNAYGAALSNVGGIDTTAAGSAVMNSMPAQRITNLYRKHFENVVQQGLDVGTAVSALGIQDANALERMEGEQKVEEMTRAMVDGLYGEGAYVRSQTQYLEGRGYVKKGVTSKGFTVFEDPATGDTRILRN